MYTVTSVVVFLQKEFEFKKKRTRMGSEFKVLWNIRDHVNTICLSFWLQINGVMRVKF